MKYILLLFLGSLILIGCVTKRSNLSSNYEVKKIQIEHNVSEIEIIDSRHNITERKIKLPFISFPGQKDKVSPVLTDDQKNMINKQIQTYFSNKGKNVKVRCEIMQAYKEFTAHVFYEREYVQVDIKIELIDADDSIIQSCTSSAFFEAKSLDATHRYMNKIYTHAIKTSLYKCFEKLD